MVDFRVKYDLVFSLGGSCASAKQLIFKKIRNCSYPLDWLFHNNSKSIEYLKTALSGDYSGWMNKENMRELLVYERGDSTLFQYQDMNTGYYSIHDFNKPVTDDIQYREVISKYQRRFSRLCNKLSISKNVLLLLDAKYDVSIEKLCDLREFLIKHYNIDNIDMVVLQFNSTSNSFYSNDWLVVYHYMRTYSNDDYNGEPPEWDFLR